MKNQTVALPLMGLGAEMRAASFDDADNTIELVWTTGASVRRYDWRSGSYYDEVLEVSADAVRLDRLNAGAPFLNTHASWDLGDVIGSVVPGTARIQGKKGVCRVMLSRAEGDRDVVQKIRDGIIRNVSVGYAINRVEKTSRGEGEVDEWRVVDWTPMEISAVPIPADAGAQIRSGGDKPDGERREFPCEIVTRSVAGDEESETQPSHTADDDAANTEERTMERDENTPAAIEPAANTDTRAPGVSPDQARAAADAAVRAERVRAAEIRKIADKFGMRDFADAAIDEGKTVDQFRNELLDKLAERTDKDGPSHGGTRGENKVKGAANKEDRGIAIQNALLHRHDANAYKLDDKAREFRGMSLIEIARDCLEVEGVSTRGMSRQEIAAAALSAGTRAGGMHSTADFPLILANVANKTLRAAYDAAPQTFRPLVRVVSVPDFKDVSRVQLGDAPQFEKVNEHGEFKRGTIGEGREQYRIATYGKVVAITRQVLINDDLGAFTRVPEMFGRQYANLESDIVWAQIIGNPVMGDGQTLFHATHGNVGTAGAISATSVAEAMRLMRLQVGLDGRTLLNISPSFIIAPVALQMALMQFLTTTTPNQTSQVVPDYLRQVTPITDPRLDGGFVNPLTGQTVSGSATNWYMAASPGAIDTVELAYLEGQQGVYTETKTGFDVDGVEVKVRADLGAKVIDWRGFFRNPFAG